MTARPLITGWKIDRKDERDHQFRDKVARLPRFPLVSSCRDIEPDIWDQETLGSCTGHGTLRTLAIERVKAQLPPLALSRLMAYLLGRIAENTVEQDAGAEIRDVIKGLARAGCCTEENWPYLIDRFAQLPPSDAWTDALGHTIKAYSSLNPMDETELKTCLVGPSGFTFGFDVPQAFQGDEIAATGFLPDPPATWTPIGGHCVCAIGYDDTKRGANWTEPGGYEVTNSYGDRWGDAGHFWVSKRFMPSGACSSLWNVTQIGYGPSTQQELP